MFDCNGNEQNIIDCSKEKTDIACINAEVACMCVTVHVCVSVCNLKYSIIGNAWELGPA